MPASVTPSFVLSKSDFWESGVTDSPTLSERSLRLYTYPCEPTNEGEGQKGRVTNAVSSDLPEIRHVNLLNY